MKTNTFKSLLVTLVLSIFVINSFAQHVGSWITVSGTNYSYSDQAWIFSEPTSTYYFDNGWDGYKMLGTSDAPQIYIPELDGNYQVASIPNLNNAYLGFIAGLDTTYTFTFTNQNLSIYYSKLYLVDSVANKTVDIFATGTTYTFTATNKTPINRFKFVTSIPVPVIPPVVIPPVVTPPVVTPPVVPPTVDKGITANNNKDSKDSKNMKDKNDKKDNKDKKLNIYNSNNTIYIENSGNKGKMKIYHAVTGRVFKNVDINSSGTTIVKADIPSGTYIVNGVNDTDDVSTVIIVR
jgi:hypothetical protein